jgi:hypothetical protein
MSSDDETTPSGEGSLLPKLLVYRLLVRELAQSHLIATLLPWGESLGVEPRSVDGDQLGLT